MQDDPEAIARSAFDPLRETPLEYNRRHSPQTVARIERLRERILQAEGKR